MAAPPKSEPGAVRLRGNWGGAKAALAALLGLALALRLVGLQYGLPYGTLLDPDEQSIVPRAWRMVHGFGLDPHWFDYPTAVLYAQAPFQSWDDTPSILTARIVIALCGVAAVAAAWWLGRRAYGTLAGAVGAAVVAVASESRPLAAIELAEALATSDLPGGVVNILTGFKSELAPWLAGHMDVNAIDVAGIDGAGVDGRSAELERLAAENVKRVVHGAADGQSLWEIAAFLELKTVWHPIGR